VRAGSNKAPSQGGERRNKRKRTKPKSKPEDQNPKCVKLCFKAPTNHKRHFQIKEKKFGKLERIISLKEPSLFLRKGKSNKPKRGLTYNNKA